MLTLKTPSHFGLLLFWLKYDFHPCNLGGFWFSSLQKKKLKNVLAKKNCLKKVPDLTKTLKWHGFDQVAVADCATFATWHAT